VSLPASCKRGHVGSYKLNAQGFPVCTLCAREARRASKERLVQRTSKTSEEGQKSAFPLPSSRVFPTDRTFLEVGREYLAARDDVAPATAVRDAWLLERLIELHARPIAQLTTPDYVHALRAIEADGDRRTTAHRCAGLAGAITRYAVNLGYAQINALPAGQLRGTLRPVKQGSFAAITDPDRFGQLLRFIRDYRLIGGRNVAAALRLAPLVFVRPGELRTAEWAEFNLDRAEWLIPAHKMKMRRPHLVPLSTQSLEILRDQFKHTGSARFVFPGREGRPLSEGAFKVALGYFCPSSEHTPHGFRSTASTMLRDQLGYDSEFVELQLAHAKSDKVAAIYDRSQRLPERRKLMQAWSDYLDALRAKASENMVDTQIGKTPRHLPSDLSTGLWAYAGERAE
jgi:integrase